MTSTVVKAFLCLFCIGHKTALLASYYNCTSCKNVAIGKTIMQVGFLSVSNILHG